jgi:hypothetical protein
MTRSTYTQIRAWLDRANWAPEPMTLAERRAWLAATLPAPVRWPGGKAAS